MARGDKFVRYQDVLLALGAMVLLFSLLALALAAASVASAHAQKVEEFLYDWEVYYINPDGWVVVAKDGYQVTGQLKVKVWVNQPGVVSLTAVIENEAILDVKEEIEFMREYTVNIPTEKYGKIITFTLQLTWGRISKTATKSFTIVENPVSPKVTWAPFLTKKQLERLMEKLTWDVLGKALIAGLAGLGAAIFLKYGAKMLHWYNALQIPVLAVAMAASVGADPEFGAGYFGVFFAINLLAYHFLKGPSLLHVLEVDIANREVWKISVPWYRTIAGRVCVAVQNSIYAVKRFLGKHVEFSPTVPIVEFWKYNGGEPLVVARRARLVKKVVEEEVGTEETEGLEVVKERRLAEVFEVEPADAHTLEFMMNAKTFDELVEDNRRLAAENAVLRAKLESALEKGAIMGVKTVARLLRGGKRAEEEEE